MHANKLIWLDGQFLLWSEAHMPVLSHHYGIGVFEGVRAYPTEDGLCIFRLSDHTDRLFRSAHILNMKIPYSKEMLNQIQYEILNKQKFTSAYIRPFVFYGDEYLGLSTKSLSVHVMIAAIEWRGGAFQGIDNCSHGIKAITSSMTRSHCNSVFSKAKANAHYMNSILAMQEAELRNAQEAILLDSQGFVTEGSSAHIFLIRDNILFTPDLSCMIEGITRDTIITLALDLGLIVKEKRMTRDEIYIADEAFFTGTAVEVTPIVEVDGRVIGNGKVGPMTQQLQRAYLNVVTSKDQKYRDWLTNVSI